MKIKERTISLEPSEYAISGEALRKFKISLNKEELKDVVLIVRKPK